MQHVITGAPWYIRRDISAKGWNRDADRLTAITYDHRWPQEHSSSDISRFDSYIHREGVGVGYLRSGGEGHVCVATIANGRDLMHTSREESDGAHPRRPGSPSPGKTVTLTDCQLPRRATTSPLRKPSPHPADLSSSTPAAPHFPAICPPGGRE